MTCLETKIRELIRSEVFCDIDEAFRMEILEGDVLGELVDVAKQIQQISVDDHFRTYFVDYDDARRHNRNYADGFLNGSKWAIQKVLGLLVENKEKKP